jgi:hypothetical protein
MKAIFDRVAAPKKFPLTELLSAIQGIFQFQPSQPVSICRLGGIGKGIWEYESQIDEGNDVVAPFSDLQKLADSDEECVDELLGSIGTICFGLSDSSFLFVQCEDKDAEEMIVSRFASVRDIPDLSPPRTPDSASPTPRG